MKRIITSWRHQATITAFAQAEEQWQEDESNHYLEKAHIIRFNFHNLFPTFSENVPPRGPHQKSPPRLAQGHEFQRILLTNPCITHWRVPLTRQSANRPQLCNKYRLPMFRPNCALVSEQRRRQCNSLQYETARENNDNEDTIIVSAVESAMILYRCQIPWASE